MAICDKKVFQNIYMQWCDPLQHFMQSRGMGLDDAADKVQESFLRLWKHCADVSADKAKSYLFSIAVRLHIDEHRREKVKLKYLDNVGQMISIRDGQYELESKEFKHKLEEAINSMTDASREVFIMNRFDDLSYKQIAETLNLSVKAIEKRMSKALAHLANRNILKKR